MPEGRRFDLTISDGERCEPVGTAIKQLAAEYSWATVVREFCLTVADLNERGKANRRNSEIMHTWLAVEIERYRSKRKITPALKAAFPMRADRQWWVFIDDRQMGFDKPATARRWHWKGRQLMEKDPKLAKRWTHNLDVAKKVVDENWTVEKAKALMDRLIKNGRTRKPARS